MPDIYAQLPDGRYLQFPDGTDPQVIQAAVKKQIAPSESTAQSPPADHSSWLQQQIEGALGLPASALDPVKHAVSTIVDQAKQHPAAAGAMLAGAATAPLTGGMSLGAAAGFSGLMAGGGAAAGLLAKDAANPDEMTGAGDAMKQIATQAALGAGGEAVARGVSAASPAVSQWLYKLGLSPSKSLTSHFPTAAETGLSEGVVPTEAAIQARLSAVENNVQQAVRSADATRPSVRGLLGPAQPTTVTEAVPLANVVKPVPVAQEAAPKTAADYAKWTEQRIANKYAPPVATAPEVQPGGVMMRSREVSPQLAPAAVNEAPPTMVSTRSLAEQARQYVLQKANLLGQGGRGLRQEATQEIDRLVSQYLTENPAPMTIADALGQKRAEQALANTAYNSEARGGTINQIEALWHQGLANANRQAVVSRVPSAAEDLAREQGLIGLKTMAKAAADRPSSVSPVTAAAVLGAAMYGHPEVALGYAALTAALKSPTLTGALGLAMKKLSTLGASGLTPAVTKALAAAYGGVMQPNDQTPEDQP